MDTQAWIAFTIIMMVGMAGIIFLLDCIAMMAGL